MTTFAASDLKYDRPPMYPKQRAAIFDERRFSCVEASTKSGKTSGCIAWIIEKALAGKEGQNFWWVAPVSGQADIAFTRARRAIPPWLGSARMSSPKTITLVNGAIIWFKSGDHPDGLYGEDVYGAVVDEASRLKEDAWYAIRSTLTATQGPVRIIGNVKGRHGWFYHLARRAQAGSDPAIGYHKITAADAIEAGVLAQEEIDDARRMLPEGVFKELYYAEASDDGGNPFGLPAIARCVRMGLSDKPLRWWGWDLAKKHDYTVGIGLDIDGAVAAFHRFQKPWPETTNTILQMTAGLPALVDSTGVGDPILDYLHKEGGQNFEGYHFTSQSKQRLMEGLARAIQSIEVTFPDSSEQCPIRNELESFEFVYSRTGVSYSCPAMEGYFDDCVCALALAKQASAVMPVPLIVPTAAMQQLQAMAPTRMQRRHGYGRG